MELPGHLEEAVGKTCLGIERGSLFPGSMASVVLFCSQTDLLPWLHFTKAFVPPGTRQLARKPGMHRLRDGDLSLLHLSVQHRRDPFFVYRFSIPLHCPCAILVYPNLAAAKRSFARHTLTHRV